MKSSLIAIGLLASLSLPAGAANAQETTTYTYDALGRVKTVTVSGGPGNGTNSAVAYDAAGNRLNVTVTGSPNGTSSGNDPGSGTTSTTGTRNFAVVPLNGYTLIFVGLLWQSFKFWATAWGLISIDPALATEQTTYTYDALGRLIESTTAGTVDNGKAVSVAYDAAGSRITYSVNGATGTGSQTFSGAVIVVPLKGYTVIPLPAAYIRYGL